MVSQAQSLALLSGYFYLADQSIAETEDRGEEEESDERTPPACLVDDDRHHPAGDLPTQNVVLFGHFISQYFSFLPRPEPLADVRW